MTRIGTVSLDVDLETEEGPISVIVRVGVYAGNEVEIVDVLDQDERPWNGVLTQAEQRRFEDAAWERYCEASEDYMDVDEED